MAWLNKGWLLTLITVLALVAIIWGPKLISREKQVEAYFGTVEEFQINDLAIFKKDDLWWVKIGQKEVPADKDKVEQMIKQLVGVKLDTLVSENKDRESEMGFGTDDKVEIRVGKKGLEVGGMGGDYSSTLVRVTSESKVYAVNSLWNRENLATIDYWKNSRVTNLPLYQITKIKISRNEKEVIWQPKDDKWDNQDVVGKIASLAALDYLENRPTDNVIATYEVETEKEKTKLEVGKMWASADGKYYYTIGKSDFDLLTSIR